MKKMLLVGLLIFIITIIVYLAVTGNNNDNIHNEENKGTVEYIKDIRIIKDDEICFVEKYGEFAEIGYHLMGLTDRFAKEVTNKSYETIRGNEGYELLSDELLDRLERENDQKRTYERYVKGKLKKILLYEPSITVCFESSCKATTFTNFVEMYTEGHGVELDVKKDVILILNFIKVKDKWYIDEIIFQ